MVDIKPCSILSCFYLVHRCILTQEIAYCYHHLVLYDPSLQLVLRSSTANINCFITPTHMETMSITHYNSLPMARLDVIHLCITLLSSLINSKQRQISAKGGSTSWIYPLVGNFYMSSQIVLHPYIFPTNKFFLLSLGILPKSVSVNT